MLVVRCLMLDVPVHRKGGRLAASPLPVQFLHLSLTHPPGYALIDKTGASIERIDAKPSLPLALAPAGTDMGRLANNRELIKAGLPITIARPWPDAFINKMIRRSGGSLVYPH